jgi:tetratricopeptide (TPR) repeat protein
MRSRLRRRLGVAILVLLPVVPVLALAQAAQTPSFDTVSKQADAAREAGRLEEAAALYRRGLEANAEWDEGLWYLGSVLYELDRPLEARDAFARLLARQPEHAGAAGLKGLCEFNAGSYEDSLRSLLRSRTLGIARTPGIATVVRYHAGMLLTKFGEFEVGYAVLSEFATEPGAMSPQVVDAFGLNLLRVPVLPAEIDAARRPLVQLAGRAASAMAARQMSAAGPLFDQLVSEFGTTPNTHYARGVFRLTEAPDQALDDFRKEIAIVPGHVPARLQIAFELIRRGEAKAARPFAEEAVKLAPGLFATRLALGQVRLELNEVDGAVEELERAAALAPGSPQTHFMLARAYVRAGRTADAERARAEFTRLDQRQRSERTGAQSIGGIPVKP